VNDLTRSRLAVLHDQPDLLAQSLRGIEKEGLRVAPDGRLALTPHPKALGAALTHGAITTDYSESLLELITGTHHRVEDMMDELDRIHRYTYSALGNEIIWNQSMPAQLPDEADIPIAWYGTSNTGQLKHVYRKGLAERYGKTMQCIAGVHYNFSFAEGLWSALGIAGQDDQARRSEGYIGLIRNFTRFNWLLMYLFGASPALSRDFMKNKPAQLEQLSHDTFFLPYATSLRMSDLGYQNKAQSQLKLSYDSLDQFLARLNHAVTQPWPEYQAIGTKRDGEWIQLNTNVLQIENEYYSNIRPKRATGRCERPITAMRERGVQYVEVRCLDIDPFAPLGITAQTARFVDAFLLFCAASESPHFGGTGFCSESDRNFSVTVKEGRKPGVTLLRSGQSVALADWGRELLDRIAPYAALLDQAYGTSDYTAAVGAQAAKLAHADDTPSARVLAEIQQSGRGFIDYTLAQSSAHAQALRARPLAPELQAQFLQASRDSIAAQAALEAGDDIDFDAYVKRYEQALKPGASTCSDA